MNTPRHWWQEAVVYQIYPRSFYDSDGDGNGDLQGIIAKLDIIKCLGVDVLWLNPIYASPEIDNGYDISDYQAINPRFGTMAISSNCSRQPTSVDCGHHGFGDQPHFRPTSLVWESRKSMENPCRDYYIWRDRKDGRARQLGRAFFLRLPGLWTNRRGSTTYTSFHPISPTELGKPALRAALRQIMAWWLEKGIDGFRLDAINLIAKAPGLPDNPGSGRYVFAIDQFLQSACLPHLHAGNGPRRLFPPRHLDCRRMRRIDCRRRRRRLIPHTRELNIAFSSSTPTSTT